MPLQPGDILFVGWDSDREDVAFIPTVDLAAGEVIYFTDSEWTGTAFAPGEQLVEWTVPAGGITAGTLLTLDFIPGGDAVVHDGGDLTDPEIGTIDYISGSGRLAQMNEMVWAFSGDRTGDDVTPTSFGGVISHSGTGPDAQTPNLTGTGLTPTSGAIIVDGDHDYMQFSGFDALPDIVTIETALETAGDPANWTVIGPGRSPGIDNPKPDGGFGLAEPRLIDADDVQTLYFSGSNVAFIDDVRSDDGDVSTTLTVSEAFFLPDDVIQIDILGESVRPDGEFDYDEVIYTRVAVTRDGVTYDFDVIEGAKIKESGAVGNGAANAGQAVEQGDTFFLTNDDVSTVFRGLAEPNPFGDLPTGRLAFALFDTFGGAGSETTIVRIQDLDLDGNGSIDPNSPEAGNANFHFSIVDTPPCFVRGTRILTPHGEVRVEDLTEGDLVVTADNGALPVRWIGSSRTQASGQFAPVRIRKGALGNNRDLLVSPQHRMLLSGWRCELLFGESEVLVPAKHLVNDHSIRPEPFPGTVDYFHILLDGHQIIYAEGCPTESFDPQSPLLPRDADATRQETLALVPDLRGPADGFSCEARLTLKSFEAQLIAC